MQSCPKNADTGPLIGNGKGAPVVSGPGLSLPPSALVGPPSPARGLAGLAPPHGANAWDTDRVQLNPAHKHQSSHKTLPAAKKNENVKNYNCKVSIVTLSQCNINLFDRNLIPLKILFIPSATSFRRNHND